MVIQKSVDRAGLSGEAILENSQLQLTALCCVSLLVALCYYAKVTELGNGVTSPQLRQACLPTLFMAAAFR